MRRLLVAAALVACSCDTGVGYVPDHQLSGRILTDEDYQVIQNGRLDRTDVHTGSVAVQQHFYYLVPDGAYWRLSDVWPPVDGAATWDIHDVTWEHMQAGGIFQWDGERDAWTDGIHFYRLAGDGLATLQLVEVD